MILCQNIWYDPLLKHLVWSFESLLKHLVWSFAKTSGMILCQNIWYDPMPKHLVWSFAEPSASFSCLGQFTVQLVWPHCLGASVTAPRVNMRLWLACLGYPQSGIWKLSWIWKVFGEGSIYIYRVPERVKSLIIFLVLITIYLVVHIICLLLYLMLGLFWYRPF